jgi:hypothetical protein
MCLCVSTLNYALYTHALVELSDALWTRGHVDTDRMLTRFVHNVHIYSMGAWPDSKAWSIYPSDARNRDTYERAVDGLGPR